MQRCGTNLWDTVSTSRAASVLQSTLLSVSAEPCLAGDTHIDFQQHGFVSRHPPLVALSRSEPKGIVLPLPYRTSRKPLGCRFY